MSKAKIVQKSVKDPDIINMFNSMLGDGNVNFDIAYPKYEELQESMNKFINLFDFFISGVAVDMIPEIKNHCKVVKSWKDKMLAEYKLLFTFPKINYETVKLTEKQSEEFTEIYNKIKKSTITYECIKTSSKLIDYKKTLEKKDPSEIIKLPSFIPFVFFPKLDFQSVLVEIGDNKRLCNFVMSVLEKIFTFSHKVYVITSSPDFDISEFSEIILNNINNIEKHIPRCGTAFKKIASSLDLLKDNFNGYYKDFIQSRDPSIIMQNFVIDVAKDIKANPELTRQFRTIVAYYQKMSNNNNLNDPKLKQIFNKLNEHFEQIEKIQKSVSNDENIEINSLNISGESSQQESE